MRPRAPLAIVVVLPVLLWSACWTLASDPDDLSAGAGSADASHDGGGGDEPRDGASVDDANDRDAEDAGPKNLLFNSDFELGCQGWTGFAATLNDFDAGRSGQRSCLVCGTTNDFGVVQAIRGVATPGLTYTAEVYVRVPEDASAGNAVYATLLVNAGPDTIQNEGGGNTVVSTAWQRVNARLTVRDAGTDLDLSVGTNAPGCFALDDARVTLAE
jgi:hypothetical protein